MHNSHNLHIIWDFWRISLLKKTHNSGSPVIRKNATYSQSSVIHPLIIIAVITIVYCTCSFWFTFCIPEQEGILYAHSSIWSVEVRQRHFLWIVYVDSLNRHLQAVFWSWMTYIGSYIPQACSLRWLDTVFQGQYLPSLRIIYVAINKVLEKLPPQLY